MSSFFGAFFFSLKNAAKRWFYEGVREVFKKNKTGGMLSSQMTASQMTTPKMITSHMTTPEITSQVIIGTKNYHR